jgi:hypothetical protein
VLLTAAGSDCAILLGQWARQAGAEAVYGIHRSAVHAERLEAMGSFLSRSMTRSRIGTVAACDVVYDATGGPLAEAILSVMPEQGMFVCYGLLSGQTFTQRRPAPRVAWFHIRNGLDALSAEAWRAEFDRIWLRLPGSEYSDVTVYPLAEWRRALSAYREGEGPASPSCRWRNDRYLWLISLSSTAMLCPPAVCSRPILTMMVSGTESSIPTGPSSQPQKIRDKKTTSVDSPSPGPSCAVPECCRTPG